MANTNIVEQLKNNAVFQLSLSSKELFHSNFLCWLANSQTALFNYLLKELFKSKIVFNPQSHVTLREYKNFDFCICKKNTAESKGSNTDEKQEYDSDEYGDIIFVLENKFKSLPYDAQLEEYEQKVLNINIGSAPKRKKKETEEDFKKREEDYKAALDNVEFVLLSLIEDVSYLGKKGCKVRNRWLHVTYKSYANALGKYFNNANDDFARELIEKYQNFISLFSEYVTGNLPTDNNIQNKEWGCLSTNNEMKSLRTDDIWQKLVASKIAIFIQSQIDGSKYSNLNIKDILNENKVEIGNITIGVGFTHGTALIDVKKKITADMIYGIQIQDGYYKRILETTEDNIKNKYDKDLKQFFGSYIKKLNGKFNCNGNESCKWKDGNCNIFEKPDIHPKESHIGKTGIIGFGGYGRTFICQSKVLKKTVTIQDVVKSIENDITNVP